MRVRQCAILVGGLGTRLGSLTAETPKPLLDCGGRPFLAWVLRELSRFGITDIVLLAGFKSEKVTAFCEEVQAWLPKPLSIQISMEPEPAGTGGALWHARHLLQDRFLLINGDSWFDTNLARLFAIAAQNPDAAGVMALRHMEDCARYGTVELQGNSIVAFREKMPGVRNGIINNGIYLLTRKALDFIQPKCSLEKDVLPELANAGILAGEALDGYFIDIGIPEDYARAGIELPARMNRPAVFFDRDGVINEDLGWVGSVDRFHWIPGAKEALQTVTDLGYHAFVVTNQAGVARGLYSEQDVEKLHDHVLEDLLSAGGTIDDVRYCPYHPEAVLEHYRTISDCRKPAPGMLLDLIARWDVARERSLLIGDKPSDIQAATAAGVKGYLFEGGNLFEFLQDSVPPLEKLPS